MNNNNHAVTMCVCACEYMYVHVCECHDESHYFMCLLISLKDLELVHIGLKLLTCFDLTFVTQTITSKILDYKS